MWSAEYLTIINKTFLLLLCHFVILAQSFEFLMQVVSFCTATKNKVNIGQPVFCSGSYNDSELFVLGEEVAINVQNFTFLDCFMFNHLL
jgi:hypothetical protein